MNKYNPNEACPKCYEGEIKYIINGEETISNRSAGWNVEYFPEIGFQAETVVSPKIEASSEHLIVTCKNCGYTEERAPMDTVEENNEEV